MATSVGLGFQISASAAGMSQGINAGVVELQKLGFQAKRTAADLSTIKTLQISQAFIGGVRAVTSAFQSFTSGASSSIDQTNKLSRALGLSFDELQKLKLAADLSGASTEQLAQAFGRAQITISKAQQGSKTATDSLRRLGLSIGELSSLSASQQFEQIAAAVARIDNPARRSAAAVEIFGRSGVQLLPVFQELSQNLQRSESFFAGFTNRLSQVDAGRITDIRDAFTETRTAAQQTAGLILSRLQPALTSAAQSIRNFLQNLDIDSVVSQASEALRQFAVAGELVGRIAGVVLQRPLVSAGIALAFLNRQALSTAAVGLGRSLITAAAAARTFNISAAAASIGANILKVSIRGLLAATGVGLVGVALGLAAEAALSFFDRTREAANGVPQEFDAIAEAAKTVNDRLKNATASAVTFGKEAKAALQIPALTAADSAQSAVNDARAAVNALARDLGGLANVPPQVLADFSEISLRAQQANEAVFDQKVQLAEVTQVADRFTQQLKAQQQLQQDNAAAAKKTADEVRRAGQEAQRRTVELAQQGLTGAEQSRIKLNQDLATIALEQVNAERALAQARQEGDLLAIRRAKERLGLVKQAADSAKEQDRQRRLDALGINRSLLEPVKTVRDQVKDIRTAFDQQLINPEQLKNALRSIADQGIQSRREIDRELSRSSAQALRVADVRSGEGLSQFLQAQRRDPALDQRAQQLSALREIRDALRENNLQVAELVG